MGFFKPNRYMIGETATLLHIISKRRSPKHGKMWRVSFMGKHMCWSLTNGHWPLVRTVQLWLQNEWCGVSYSKLMIYRGRHYIRQQGRQTFSWPTLNWEIDTYQKRDKWDVVVRRLIGSRKGTTSSGPFSAKQVLYIGYIRCESCRCSPPTQMRPRGAPLCVDLYLFICGK